jgi:hypothetical protein
MSVDRFSNQFLPGPAGMAAFHGIGRVMLPAHPRFSKGRDVWVDIANQAFCRFCSCEYRGRSWTGKYPKLHSIPPHRPRIIKGAGDTSTARREDGHGPQSGHRCPNGAMREPCKNASIAYSIAAEKRRRIANGGSPMVSGRRSPFTTRYSPLAIRIPAVTSS